MIPVHLSRAWARTPRKLAQQLETWRQWQLARDRILLVAPFPLPTVGPEHNKWSVRFRNAPRSQTFTPNLPPDLLDLVNGRTRQ